MKTSNKLLLVLFIIFLISVTSTAFYIKNGLKNGYNKTVVGNGSLITKDLGKLRSGSMFLSGADFTIDPHSDRITVTGSSNVLESYDSVYIEGVFHPRRRWRTKLNGEDRFYNLADNAPKLSFNIGVQGQKDLDIELSHQIDNAICSFKDTLVLDNFTMRASSDQETFDINLIAKRTSIKMANWNTNMQISGSSDYLYLEVIRDCEFDAKNLSVKNASIDMGPFSTAYLNVSNAVLGKRDEASELILNGEVDQSGLMLTKADY